MTDEYDFDVVEEGDVIKFEDKFKSHAGEVREIREVDGPDKIMLVFEDEYELYVDLNELDDVEYDVELLDW